MKYLKLHLWKIIEKPKLTQTADNQVPLDSEWVWWPLFTLRHVWKTDSDDQDDENEGGDNDDNKVYVSLPHFTLAFFHQTVTKMSRWAHTHYGGTGNQQMQSDDEGSESLESGFSI